jgi:hypothetical protein
MIDLTTFFDDLGIVGNINIVNGEPSYTQRNFFNGIEWDDGDITYNQYDFFKKVGLSRYEFFKQYGGEKEFYESTNDSRIRDFYTFYYWAGIYLVGLSDNWILFTGFWDDSNIWVDTENWID